MDFPAAVLSMLSEDFVFFEDNDISWDGEHHAVIGLQANQSNLGASPDLF